MVLKIPVYLPFLLLFFPHHNLTFPGTGASCTLNKGIVPTWNLNQHTWQWKEGLLWKEINEEVKIPLDSTTGMWTLPFCSVCLHSCTSSPSTALLCSYPLQSCNRKVYSNDSPLLPAQDPHALRWRQAGLLREPRETDTHRSGIWDRLCWLLPLNQKSDSKGQAGKFDGIAWHYPVHRHAASKAEMKGRLTFLLPPPGGT